MKWARITHTKERKEIYKKFCFENMKGGGQFEDIGT
jgi:hypothetical protein